MLRRPLLGALALALLAFATPAAAHEIEVGSLVLTDLWTRATAPGAPSAAGYLTITNTGSEPDRLTGAASPAGTTSLHETATENGVATMRPLESIEIPAGGKVTLGPSGMHIMVEGLTEPLTEGGMLPMTLTFEKAGSVDTFLHILAIGATAPDGSAGGMDMDHMDHMDMDHGGMDHMDHGSSQ